MEHSNEDLFNFSPISDNDLKKLKEATNLLDETYEWALQEDSFQKSYDGSIQVNISYGTYFGRLYGEDLDGQEFTKPKVTYTALSYIIGDYKRNEFDNVDELLSTIKCWHSDEKKRLAERNK